MLLHVQVMTALAGLANHKPPWESSLVLEQGGYLLLEDGGKLRL